MVQVYKWCQSMEKLCYSLRYLSVRARLQRRLRWEIHCQATIPDFAICSSGQLVANMNAACPLPTNWKAKEHWTGQMLPSTMVKLAFKFCCSMKVFFAIKACVVFALRTFCKIVPTKGASENTKQTKHRDIRRMHVPVQIARSTSVQATSQAESEDIWSIYSYGWKWGCQSGHKIGPVWYGGSIWWGPIILSISAIKVLKQEYLNSHPKHCKAAIW